MDRNVRDLAERAPHERRIAARLTKHAPVSHGHVTREDHQHIEGTEKKSSDTTARDVKTRPERPSGRPPNPCPSVRDLTRFRGWMKRLGTFGDCHLHRSLTPIGQSRV